MVRARRIARAPIAQHTRTYARISPQGQGASAEEADATGYRVLGVQPNSPASDVGLVSFFDFVVAVDGVELRELDSTFIDKIKAARPRRLPRSRRATPRRASAPPQSEDRPLPCVVYNLKSRQTRSVTITPTRNWGGQGMLGVTIRFDTYHKADEHLVRVLEVAPGSPAEIAGLRAGTDYLLGTAERVFGDSDARRAASRRPGGRATRVASRAGPQRRVHAAPRQTRRVLRLQHGDRRGPRRRPPPDVLLGRRRLPRRRGRARLPPPPPREVSRVERRLHRARAARRAQRPRRHGRRRAAAAAAARGRPAAADRGPRRLRGGRRPAPAAAE